MNGHEGRELLRTSLEAGMLAWSARTQKSRYGIVWPVRGDEVVHEPDSAVRTILQWVGAGAGGGRLRSWYDFVF